MDTPHDPESNNTKRMLQLARPHWQRLAWATLSLIAGSGIGLIYPQAARLTIDDIIKEGGFHGYTLTQIGLALLVLFALQAVVTSVRYYLFTSVGDRIVADLRNQLYASIMGQEMGFFDARGTGELTSRLASDTQVLQGAVTSNLSMLLRFGAQGLGGAVLLFVTSPKLAGIMMIALPIVVGAAVIYGRMVRKLSRQVQDAIARSTEVAEEAIAGIRTVRSFAREQAEQARYGVAVEESYALARHRASLGAIFGGFVTFMGYGAIAVVLAVGSRMVAAGDMTPGDLAAFILYTLMVAVSLGVLSNLYGDFMRAIGASERVFTLLDRVPLLPIAEHPRYEPPQTAAVRFEDVTFSYPTRPQVEALHSVSLTLSPGQKLALVGPSGSGKSTIAHLVGRFYDPQAGQILVDGTDVRDWDITALRESIGVVAQEPLLFSGTIRDNVLYGRPGASDDEVIQALRDANAWEFVSTFPEALETAIGERGVRLSGGQKQRIAIARAILKDPRILVLDEATSALDVESESLVQRALERLMEGRTTLIIAHRLSTIRNADQVVVIQDGQVVESGDHKTLMAHGALYTRLVESQQLLE
jgi:ABC transporter fused permease/ATP-binding protein